MSHILVPSQQLKSQLADALAVGSHAQAQLADAQERLITARQQLLDLKDLAEKQQSVQKCQATQIKHLEKQLHDVKQVAADALTLVAELLDQATVNPHHTRGEANAAARRNFNDQSAAATKHTSHDFFQEDPANCTAAATFITNTKAPSHVIQETPYSSRGLAPQCAFPLQSDQFSGSSDDGSSGSEVSEAARHLREYVMRSVDNQLPQVYEQDTYIPSHGHGAQHRRRKKLDCTPGFDAEVEGTYQRRGFNNKPQSFQGASHFADALDGSALSLHNMSFGRPNKISQQQLSSNNARGGIEDNDKHTERRQVPASTVQQQQQQQQQHGRCTKQKDHKDWPVRNLFSTYDTPNQPRYANVPETNQELETSPGSMFDLHCRTKNRHQPASSARASIATQHYMPGTSNNTRQTTPVHHDAQFMEEHQTAAFTRPSSQHQHHKLQHKQGGSVMPVSSHEYQQLQHDTKAADSHEFICNNASHVSCRQYNSGTDAFHTHRTHPTPSSHTQHYCTLPQDYVSQRMLPEVTHSELWYHTSTEQEASQAVPRQRLAHSKERCVEPSQAYIATLRDLCDCLLQQMDAVES